MQALLSSSMLAAKPIVGARLGIGASSISVPARLMHRLIVVVRAQADDKQVVGKTALKDSVGLSGNGADITQMPTGEELEKVLKDMSPEQQKQLAQLYMFLTQHPEARVDLKNLGNVKQAVNNYQVLLWRPAELLNGRMAMIGFTAALANEALTGASLWQQLYFAPYAYFSAYLLVAVAAQLNRAFGRPQEGVGPFTRYAEIVNGRAAMLGYVILAYVEYNQELRNAASVMYSRLQQQGSIGV